MSKIKSLIIGLDGATFDIIYPWIQQGELPNLKKLMESGCSGELETTFPPITACAWSSFFTGKNPGKHNIYDFLYREEGKYTSKPNNRLTRKSTDYWKILNHYDFSTGLVNVPMTYPPGEIDGYMVTGIMTPRKKSVEETNYTYPESLKSELKEGIGKYVIHPKVPYRKGKSKSVYEETVEDLKIKSKTIQFLMEKHPTDSVMFVIGGTDLIMHNLFHLIDSNHPYYDSEEAERDSHFVKDYFRLADEELGLIIDKFCDDDTLIVVMSDHGMGPLYKWVHLNVWLMREGYLKLKSNFFVMIKKLLFDIGFTPSSIYRLLLKFGYSKSKMSFEKRDRLISKLFLSWNDIDWRRTEAYSRGHVGQIFINKKGREPQGIVTDEQFDALKKQIMDKLLQLKDEGKNVIEKMSSADEIYNGPYKYLAADILFMPYKLEYFALGTSAFISNRVVELCFGSTGTHRMNGIFIIKGPGIKKNYKIEGARIIDVVPNLLFYCGLPLDKDMDGKVLDEIYEPDLLNTRKIEYKDMDKELAAEKETGEVYSSDEAAAVEKQLKDLGYLG